MARNELNGISLFYESAGEGECIVMTHGAWTDGRAWDAVVEHLPDRFEIVTWDRRGHGRSGDGPAPGSTREDAADLAAIIEQIGSRPVHLVGTSAGGNVVLNLVTSRPELVKSAAVHEPGPFGLLGESGDPHLVAVMEHEKVLTDHVVDLIEAGQHREAARYFVDNVAIGPGAWDQFPEDLRQLMASNAPTVPDDLRDGWDVGSVDVDLLSTSSVPLLITTGTESPELEAGSARELARRVPSSRLETVQGAGHIPHRTHPAEYAALLASFVESAPSTSEQVRG